MTTVAEPARRFVNAQSWWIASELVRRHPHLLLLETHPGGGQYDCLSLVDPRRPATGAVVHINRVGRIHVLGNDAFDPIRWDAAMAAPGGHDVVRTLEAAAGLPAPTIAPVSGPKTLTYRVLARVLTSLVDDGHEWDARNGFCDSSGMGSFRRLGLDAFPSVVESLRDGRIDDVDDEPAYRFWLLQRGQDPVACLDIDGRVHFTDRAAVELLPAYRRSERSLTMTIAETLGHALP